MCICRVTTLQVASFSISITTRALGLLEEGVLDSGLPVPLEPTIYARFKDWPLLGLLILLGLGLAVATRLADEA